MQRLGKLLKIVPVRKWWRLSTISWVSEPNSNDNTGKVQGLLLLPKPTFLGLLPEVQPTYLLSQPLSLAVHQGPSCLDGEPGLWPWPQYQPMTDKGSWSRCGISNWTALG